jgi:hypothetical protein
LAHTVVVELRPNAVRILFGVPRLTAAYSSGCEVAQSPNDVVFLMETIHDARVNANRETQYG